MNFALSFIFFALNAILAIQVQEILAIELRKPTLTLQQFTSLIQSNYNKTNSVNSANELQVFQLGILLSRNSECLLSKYGSAEKSRLHLLLEENEMKIKKQLEDLNGSNQTKYENELIRIFSNMVYKYLFSYFFEFFKLTNYLNISLIRKIEIS